MISSPFPDKPTEIRQRDPNYNWQQPEKSYALPDLLCCFASSSRFISCPKHVRGTSRGRAKTSEGNERSTDGRTGLRAKSMYTAKRQESWYGWCKVCNTCTVPCEFYFTVVISTIKTIIQPCYWQNIAIGLLRWKPPAFPYGNSRNLCSCIWIDEYRESNTAHHGSKSWGDSSRYVNTYKYSFMWLKRISLMIEL